ncbi:MAG: ABC transporter ATP-binding protein, partial [Candidatus Aenigmarchaeota archaeon]|nr:ABC transporter ATP-binding protein [Candidatus Aenigmarchaeota archaeon]
RPAVEIRNLSKIYKVKKGNFFALKDINLTIEKGEIFGLLGPNGAGKTTLLSVLVGLLYPEKGEARVLGEEPYKNRDILEKMNFVSGGTRFHWSLHVVDILKYYGMAYNVPQNTIQKRIEELLKFFEISNIRNKKFAWLSTGERMRLILAKALLNRPEVLLLDEPTLGLDPDIAMKVRREIKKVNKRFGTTILLTSHYMNEVEQLSDRVGFIHRGKIVDVGSVEKVKLSKFDTYDVFVQVDKVKSKEALKRKGFGVVGNRLSKKLSYDENLSEVLSTITNLGYKIHDVETKRPTLEDYFVKILNGEKVNKRL